MVDGKLIAAPLARGAGAAMSLVRANGFCVIEQNSEGIEAGDIAPIELYSSTEEIEKTALVIGSHDLILDVIADIMITESRGRAFLASAHVGSMAGLMALKRGECHITPAHLLDEETGAYNIPYIKRMFPKIPVILIKGVGRIQGLMVKKGNPLNINSVNDLTRCRYINRQRGAGTRLLLDFKLKQAGVSPDQIDGYEREAATHMAAAATVAANSADAALGILSAALALNLDFIPLGNEEYDFVLYPRFLELPHIRYFTDILQNRNFHKRLEKLGGYTWDKCGEIINVE
jgi:putative molybdopterin biosynthesis protein